MRVREGPVRPLPIDDWCAPASAGEVELLAGLRGPVLDLGCGPGRLVVALGQLGIPAMGIDASPQAIGLALAVGASVLERSVFDPLPGEGRWPSVLLFDGNVGIGGDPVALLRRVTSLLAETGLALVEVGPPGTATTTTSARLEWQDEATTWFPWAWVGADGLDEMAWEAGLARRRWRRVGPRWFAELIRDTT
jgi:SAM-dependent methyltransferase